MRKTIIRTLLLFGMGLSAYSALAQNTDTLGVISMEGEKWYNGFILKGHEMPMTTGFAHDYHTTWAYNQLQPILLSTKGRYAYSSGAWDLKIKEGVVTVGKAKEGIVFKDEVSDLKSGYQALAKEVYAYDGRMPDELLFKAPQINSWIELGYNHNQKDILKYADDMLANGIPPGVLMIDDTWQEDYGVWEFHPRSFPDPKEMMDKLHAKGFKVMLWICPFVSADSKPFRELLKTGGLVLDANKEPLMVKWWNGYSAVIDFSHPEGKRWFEAELDRLQEKYGVDGFKFDAGDIPFYRDAVFHQDITAHEQCRLFNEVGVKYPLNEFRVAWKMGGAPLAQRLCDKGHKWSDLQKLVPHIILEGLMGYAFTCPDMIGGGEINSFNKSKIDEELVVRSAQVHALMPMMQFSANPFRLLSATNQQYVKDAVALRQEFVPYIMELAKATAETGMPIVRAMEFEFPNQGLEDAKEQFMLGDKWLIAPVVQKGQTTKQVYLPKGKWKDSQGKVWKGGKMIALEVGLGDLPRFEKLK